MNSRRFTLSLGVVGSGVLATAFFQAAVAAADKYDITPDPTSAGPFTAIDGMPPQDQAVAGLQYYNYQDLTTGDTGSFEGLSLHDVAASGVTNQEILALPQALAMQRDALVGGDNAPAQGSFFDTLNYGNGVDNVYTDLAGTGLGSTNTISDTVVTPFGNFTMPTTFDATAALQPAEFTYPSNSAVFPGYSFVPDANDHLEIRSIGGTLPFDQSVSGIQIYDVDDATGTEVDQFEGVSFNDANAVGQTNQEILVTDNLAFTIPDPVKAAAQGGFGGGGFRGGGFGGDSSPATPSPGSVFETTNYGHGFENVYSDVAATDTTPQIVNDSFVTPFGDLNIPTTFDASAAAPAAQFTYPAGSSAFGDFSYVPDSANAEFVTSTSGQALMSQTVTGRQLYDVENPSGTEVGSFEGVSTHQVDALGFSNQEILVTGASLVKEPTPVAQDLLVSGYDGTDAPAAGSFFDTFSGFGYENIYSDVVAANGATNTITDTLVTPFGDINIPVSFTATDALTAASFLFPTGSTAVDAAAALNPSDFGAELSSLLDLGHWFSF